MDFEQIHFLKETDGLLAPGCGMSVDSSHLLFSPSYTWKNNHSLLCIVLEKIQINSENSLTASTTAFVKKVGGIRLICSICTEAII
jgi:hypothetical protein